jgi:putative glutamine amidotransferase
MQPLIGISCGTFYDRDWCPPSFGHRRTYVDAIVAAGGVPLLMPPLAEADVLRTLYDRVDGLLLAGGGDIAPALYGEEPHEKIGMVDPLRDAAELPMARWAVTEGKPVLGICRGIQVLNVALGGTLYQDVGSQLATDLIHDSSFQKEDWAYMAHDINIEPGTRLATALGVETLPINSLHHQSVKALAPGLRAVAWAADGVIEAIEGNNGAFIVGVQCHPEALQATADPRWQGLFRVFVEAARTR